MDQSPHLIAVEEPAPRNMPLDLVLTIVLCGIWNIVVQHSQMKAINYLLKREKYVFWKVYLLSLLTCGIYLIIFEYHKAQDIGVITGKSDETDTILAIVLSVVGLHIVFDAIMQNKINAALDDRQIGIR